MKALLSLVFIVLLGGCTVVAPYGPGQPAYDAGNYPPGVATKTQTISVCEYFDPATGWIYTPVRYREVTTDQPSEVRTCQRSNGYGPVVPYDYYAQTGAPLGIYLNTCCFGGRNYGTFVNPRTDYRGERPYQGSPPNTSGTSVAGGPVSGPTSGPSYPGYSPLGTHVAQGPQSGATMAPTPLPQTTTGTYVQPVIR